MSNNDQKLTTDHKKVTHIIKQYKNINLVGTAGEPPDEYDIEYKVRGYAYSPDGKIKVNKQHRVRIKLPFGYPHFPPTVKPLSPIFHPDIDANVVRIADHWEKNKSLADLVLHFGEMICGKVYSYNSPFNQEAADFYIKNKKSLPLDSLKLATEDKEIVHEKAPVEFNFPIFKILIAICLLILVGGGGFYFFEKNKIAQLEEVFRKARIYKEDQEYKKAQATAQSALDKLQSVYLLKSSGNSLRQSINSFMQSKSLQEGIKGKIQFEGEYISIETVHKLELFKPLLEKARKVATNGNKAETIHAYEKALDYASKNGLTTEKRKVEIELAELRLQQLVSSSEKAHKSKDWNWAIREHKKVLNFIKKEKEFLKDSSSKQASRTRYLLMLDQIALYSQKASQAEAKQDLPAALKNYNALIDFIGKSGAQSNATLKKTLIESMQKAAIVIEKLNIINKREWLLTNYKDIFQSNYPSTIAAALRSPQAIFIRYEGNNLLYDLSCLEKGQGSVVRLRVYYQYNPDSLQWSVFNGEI